MGLIHVPLGEVDVIGRNNRQTHGIGQIQGSRFGDRFMFGQGAVLAGVALQFDIETVGIGLGQFRTKRLGLVPLSVREQLTKWSSGASGQTDQTVGIKLQLLHGDMGEIVPALQKVARVQFEQIEVSRLVLSKQNNGAGFGPFFTGTRGIAVSQIELTADDRLHACTGHILGKLQRREEVARIGHSNCGHPRLAGHFGERFDLHRPLKKRIGGVQAEVNESRGLGHGLKLDRNRAGENRANTTNCSSNEVIHNIFAI